MLSEDYRAAFFKRKKEAKKENNKVWAISMIPGCVNVDARTLIKSHDLKGKRPGLPVVHANQRKKIKLVSYPAFRSCFNRNQLYTSPAI